MLNLIVYIVSLKKYAHRLNNGLRLSGTLTFSEEKEKEAPRMLQFIEGISI